MKLSASQAAKAVTKSIPTITRAIKSGKLSANKLTGGGYEIDPAELFRVWPAVTHDTATNSTMLEDETPSETPLLRVEVEALRQQIAGMVAERERERSQLSETIEDLRRRLDAESSERRALSAILTDQRQKIAEPPRKGFWSRLVG